MGNSMRSKDLTLEEVASKFEDWRKTKKPGDRIPLELWQTVKKISGYYRITHVTQMLRISTEKYYKHIQPRSTPVSEEAATRTFVKVSNPLLQQNSIVLRLELCRKDGTTLNCYYPNTEILHETIRWFVG